MIGLVFDKPCLSWVFRVLGATQAWRQESKFVDRLFRPASTRSPSSSSPSDINASASARHSLHWLLTRWWGQMLAQPHFLHVLSGAGGGRCLHPRTPCVAVPPATSAPPRGAPCVLSCLSPLPVPVPACYVLPNYNSPCLSSPYIHMHTHTCKNTYYMHT